MSAKTLQNDRQSLGFTLSLVKPEMGKVHFSIWCIFLLKASADFNSLQFVFRIICRFSSDQLPIYCVLHSLITQYYGIGFKFTGIYFSLFLVFLFFVNAWVFSFSTAILTFVVVS